MIVSYEHNFIFIKTRKTAGSTLEYILRPHLNPKTDISSGSTLDNLSGLNFPMDWNGHLGRIYLGQLMTDTDWKHFQNNGFIFTIERNPWDKVASQFYWFKQRWGAEKFPYTFEDYVRGMSKYSLPSDKKLYMYSDKSLVTHKIFKYEEIWELHEYLDKNYNIDIYEQWSNTKLKKSKKKPIDYRYVYDDDKELISIVSNTFRDEIKLLGYTYE